MKTKLTCVAVAIGIAVSGSFQETNAQSPNPLPEELNYCSTSRFATTDVFTNAQLQYSDVTYGYNTDWEGKRDTLNVSLYYPNKQLDAFAKRPLIVLIHGGGFLKGSYTTEKDNQLYFARKGFVAASIEYRIGWNHQCVAKNFTVSDAVYRAMQDAKASIRYLVTKASVYKIDTTNIFLFGSSAGAVTSLMISFVDENEFNSTFPGTSKRLGRLDNATNSLKNGFSIKGLASKSGAVPDASFIKAADAVPVLMFHGTADHIVPYGTGHPYGCIYYKVTQGSYEIKKRLNNLGESYELDYQVGVDHNVYEGDDLFLRSRLSHFFKRILCNEFREIIYKDKTLIQEASSPCKTLTAKIKSKTDVSCQGGSDGSVTVGKNGGESPYHYKLNGGAFQAINIFNNLSAGAYTATVKDGRGCTASVSVKIANGINPCVTGGSPTQNINAVSGLLNAKIFPNPSSFQFNLKLQSNNNEDVEVEVTDMYGRQVYRTEGSAKHVYIFGRKFASGMYMIKIRQGKIIQIIKAIKA